MKTALRVAALTAAAVGILGFDVVTLAQTAATAKPIQVAQFTADGKLQKPADLDSWVFLGTSLGMGYNPGSFNAAHPGQFQVVLMEPTAYRYFVQNRSYAPGSMFLLSFYDSDTQQRSINQNGFTQADLTNYEIHVIDLAKGDKADKGHAFYVFNPNDTQGKPLPAGNACVRCHVEHGAFDGTFAQFYPTLRPMIPKEALERAAQDHNIR
jgi:cytochrome P460